MASPFPPQQQPRPDSAAAAAAAATDDGDDDDRVSDWASSLGDARRTQDLFTDAVHPSPEAALEAAARRGCDLRAVVRRLGLDTYGRMRLINWIRQVGASVDDVLGLGPEDEDLHDETLLAPVIPDDPLLLLDFGEGGWSEDEGSAEAAEGAEGARIRPPASAQDDAEELTRLRAEVKHLRAFVSRSLEDGPEADRAAAAANVRAAQDDRGHDGYYFDSYAENEIHEVMLKDTRRTLAYARFILSNPAVFRGATVLDVGAGTGILSMFAARAGAKHVYAIEASDLAGRTRDNVAENGLQNVITVIQARVEEVDLPVKSVDIIISEWMGYMLLYESMLDSVLAARDRFLVKGGLMAPARARLVLEGITAESIWAKRVDFWDKVYGFGMRRMATPYFDEGLVEIVAADEVVTTESVVLDIDTHTATAVDLDFGAPFRLMPTGSAPTTVRAILAHFDTLFTPAFNSTCTVADVADVGYLDPADLPAAVAPLNADDTNPVAFSTGPRAPPTHWKQVAFLLRSPVTLAPGRVLEGKFVCRKSRDNMRALDIEIHYVRVDADGGGRGLFTVQNYRVR